MSINVAETKQAFPFPYDRVFDGLVKVMGPSGFEVKTQDRMIGRITASSGMSAFSWGEDLAIQVQRREELSTEISIQSNLKLGANLTATAKNAKNAERIIGALANYLRDETGDVAKAVAAAPDTNSPGILWILAAVFGVIMFLYAVSIGNALG